MSWQCCGPGLNIGLPKVSWPVPECCENAVLSQSESNPMNPLLPTIWNVLHDGCIDRIVGAVPGEVQVFVRIEYLRGLFSDDGEAIVVHLANCESFTYRRNDAEKATTEFEAIATNARGK